MSNRLAAITDRQLQNRRGLLLFSLVVVAMIGFPIWSCAVATAASSTTVAVAQPHR